jgi:nitroreductase
MNETMKNILERRSIRKYKPDMVEKELLDQVIEAGLYAAHGTRQAVLGDYCRDGQGISA